MNELLHIPWTEMHCGALAQRVLSDVLELDVPEDALTIDLDAPDLAGRVERLLAEQGERWERIGDSHEAATAVGDVILSKGREQFGGQHVSTVIQTDPIPWALTTTIGVGSPHRIEPRRIPGVLGVYRLREASVA